MRAQKEAGQLFERQDIMASFGAILNGLKSAVLSWPQRTAKSMIGLVQQWLKEEGIDIDPIKLAPLETRILNIAAKESNHVLKAIARNDKGQEAELDKIVEKKQLRKARLKQTQKPSHQRKNRLKSKKTLHQESLDQ